MKINNLKGFTLIELLIVISIISILSGIVIVSLTGETESADNAVKRLNIAQLRTPAIVQELKLRSSPTGDLADVCGDLDGDVSIDVIETTLRTCATGICCHSTTAGWRIFTKLKDNNLYCTDSKGVIGEFVDVPAVATNKAPACK